MTNYLNGPDNAIGWCDYTWNPITGCMHGCKYCYARAMFKRFKWSFEPAFHEKRLDAITKLKPREGGRPWRIFLGSTTDMFCEGVEKEWVARLFDTIQDKQGIIFQILTKRPDRIREYLEYYLPDPASFPALFPHVWMGTSITGPRDESRIQEIIQVDAAVRFISYEPYARYFNLADYLRGWYQDHAPDCNGWSSGNCDCTGYQYQLPGQLDWVILGALTKNGKTVEKHRPTESDVRSVVEQCQSESVPIYVKGNVGCFDEMKQFPQAIE